MASKQSTISSFFGKPNKENVFGERKSTNKTPLHADRTPPKPQNPRDPPINAKKTRSAEWWTTPPKTRLPGSQKRSNAPIPSQPFPSTKKQALPLAKSRPIVRPSGMASRTSSSSQPSAINSLLTPEQKLVLDAVVDRGESVFFTGAAGTGKSHLLKQIVRQLKRGRYDSEVAITATTGLAAFNIGGQTLHRWAGVRTGSGPVTSHVQHIRKNPGGVRDNWRACRVLVIDEVSMLDAELLDKLEEIARLIRGSQEPFGGIQVVLCGDFFQLPPVGNSSATKLCFEAACWPKVVKNSVALNKIFRQKDNRLVEMLNAMRVGLLNDDVVARFKLLARPVSYDDNLAATELYPLRSQVDSANKSKLEALPGPVFAFEARDTASFESGQKLLDQLICHKKLELKIGAQVMLTRNLSDQLVNGRRGTVLTFCSEAEWTVLGSLLLSNKRLLELYNAELCDRVSSQPNSPERDSRLAELLAILESTNNDNLIATVRSPIATKLPVVDFRQGDVVPLDRVDFTAVPAGRTGEVSRNQIPLVPSWALSIHKAQGQTLDRLVVDLGRVFEAGQAYVAVSRATSYDRLQIKNFSRDRVRVHPKVAQFYEALSET